MRKVNWWRIGTIFSIIIGIWLGYRAYQLYQDFKHPVPIQPNPPVGIPKANYPPLEYPNGKG